MDSDELLTCPFDPIHKIIKYRMPYHIVKCQKNYNGEELIQCHFNAIHWVPPRLMVDHLKECKDYRIATMDEQRKRVDKQTRSIIASRTGKNQTNVSHENTRESLGTSGFDKY